MKNMVLLWSTSVVKDTSNAPSHFVYFFLLFFFSLSLCPESHPNLWGNHSLHHPFLTGALLQKWLMMIITLLFTYNSKEIKKYKLDTYDKIWLYMNASGMYQDVQWSSVTCMKKWWTVAEPQLLCQLYDHAKQYDNECSSHQTEVVEVAWQYISEWPWKSHNR